MTSPHYHRKPQFEPHPQARPRRCLNPACRAEFMSQHHGVRFCEGCRWRQRNGFVPDAGGALCACLQNAPRRTAREAR